MNNPQLLHNIQIRLAQQVDLPAMEWQGDLIHFRRLFNDAYEQVCQGNAEIWLAYLNEYWYRPPALIGQLLLSLRCAYSGHLDSAYLYGFRVKEQYRSQGVGSLLLARVEESLRKKGCDYLTLNVARTNLDALRLYERSGFRVIGEDEGHWFYIDHLGMQHEVNEPAWRMEKRLF